MKNKILLVVLALALVLGMAACKDGGGGTTPPGKSIIITGLSGKTGGAAIILMASIDDEGTAMGEGTISGDSATLALKKSDGKAWTGSGSYHLLFAEESTETIYAYTDGKTLATLGITDIESDFGKLPKYNITAEKSTIPFDKFVEVDIEF
jgi:hypothetical protein